MDNRRRPKCGPARGGAELLAKSLRQRPLLQRRCLFMWPRERQKGGTNASLARQNYRDG